MNLRDCGKRLTLGRNTPFNCKGDSTASGANQGKYLRKEGNDLHSYGNSRPLNVVIPVETDAKQYRERPGSQ